MRTFKLSMAATAALLAGSMMTPASAADLGGNCCADLEERIAELEATTVRKGNRKVSLSISGFVSSAVMFWDDGTQSDMYVGDGANYGSRFRFTGTAKINPQMTAGFLYEFAVNANALGSMNQLNDGQDLGGSGNGCATGNPRSNSQGCLALRDATVWLRHQQFGELRIGHGSTATDNLILVDLGRTSGAATSDAALYMGGFILRAGNGTLANTTGLNWTGAMRGHESWDTARRNGIRYETPALHGFTLQAAAAEDNFWDVALRYAGEHHGFRIAAAIGYFEDSNFNLTSQQLTQNGALCSNNCDVKATEWMAAGSILHVPTGIFVTAATGSRELSGNGTNVSAAGVASAGAYGGPDVSFWYVAGGLSKNVFGLGTSVFFAEYGEYQGGLAQNAFLAGTGSLTTHDTVTDNTVTFWGLGFVQHIDAAAMEVFIAYKNQSFSGQGFLGTNAALNAGVNDMQSVIIGARINF